MSNNPKTLGEGLGVWGLGFGRAGALRFEGSRFEPGPGASHTGVSENSGTLFGVLIIRILLFRVLYYCPLFSEIPHTKLRRKLRAIGSRPAWERPARLGRRWLWDSAAEQCEGLGV